MRAAVGRRYGGPDVVAVAELPVPQPRDGEAHARVDAGHKKGNIVVTMA